MEACSVRSQNSHDRAEQHRHEKIFLDSVSVCPIVLSVFQQGYYSIKGSPCKERHKAYRFKTKNSRKTTSEFTNFLLTCVYFSQFTNFSGLILDSFIQIWYIEFIKAAV